MNTPAHLLVGAAAFGRAGQAKVTFAALLGALMPDLSLYVLAGGSIFLLGVSPQIVFDQYYFSDSWQAIFAVDNSFVIWGLVLGLAIWLKRGWLVAFASAGLLHLALDFPLHHDDARRHFWPVSDWVFESPVSYWDSRHYGNIVGPIEALMCIGLCVILWRRFTGIWSRFAIVAAGLFQMAPFVFWIMVF